MPHLPTLLVQIGVILALARLVGWIFRKIHQPQVMGEMVAGILLGPTLLGWIAPGISAALFPPQSLGYLSTLSQAGLLIFMFLVGLELDLNLLKSRRRITLITSYSSIAAPFLLGILLAFYLYPNLADESVSFANFALFIGTAMSITAFPVLARILAERKLLHTQLGTVAIACAAVDDVTGWILLSVVVLLARSVGAGISLWVTLIGTAIFIALMVFGVRRLFYRLEAVYKKRGAVTQDMLTIILLLVLASSWVTEQLGIHALFGAFLAGAILPKHDGLVHALGEKLNDLTVVLFLPLFFAFIGLRTSLGLLRDGNMWFFCGLIIVVAIAGKFGGSALSARLTGMPWREAGALGILVNTRGLMELVLLNIGLEIGVISPALFTMLVLMALVTTFMTAPLLEWIYFSRFSPKKYEAPETRTIGAVSEAVLTDPSPDTRPTARS